MLQCNKVGKILRTYNPDCTEMMRVIDEQGGELVYNINPSDVSEADMNKLKNLGVYTRQDELYELFQWF